MRASPPLPYRLVAALLATMLVASPALGDPAPSSASASAIALPPQPVLAPRAPAPPDDAWRALRFEAGVSLGVVGLVGLVLTGVLVGRAVVDKGNIGAHCTAAGQCDLTGYTLGSDARDLALIASVTLGAGLTVAAAGVGLVLSAKPWKPGLGPRSAGASAWIAPTPTGVTAGARW
jgi:hypothetical protein